jgi:hypothetical protein
MMHHPFQIARWALLASFAVMVFAVAFPNPSPSRAWKLAEQDRYDKRRPESRKPPEPRNSSETQLASGPKTMPKVAENVSQEALEKPLQTAQLPPRSESRDDLPRGVRIQEPIIFFEDEESAESNLAPDPAHLETPSEGAHP